MHDHLYDLSKADELKMIGALVAITLVLFTYLGVLIHERQTSEIEKLATTNSLESNLSSISESLNKRD